MPASTAISIAIPVNRVRAFEEGLLTLVAQQERRHPRGRPQDQRSHRRHRGQAQGGGRRLRQDVLRDPGTSETTGTSPRWPASRTCASASPPPRRRRRSPRPCRWSRRRSCAARRPRPKPRGPTPSAWRRCWATSPSTVADINSAPRLLAGTGAGPGASAGGLHRRARPVRRVQLLDRAARARARSMR